jgi:Zn-dependent peptidase ImmA (M78 family)/transcriptional regulator with XRE-family HTH domain
MSDSLNQLFGHRLRQARAMRAWSLRELTARMGGEVSPAALNKYEAGRMRPSPAVLAVLCEALGVDEDFFVRPVRVPLGAVNFRKRSSLGAKEERALREHAGDFFERYAELEERLGLAAAFENPLADFVVQEPDDVETAALRVRQAWKLGLTPIPSVVARLEAQHLMIHAEDAPEAFDGFAGRAGAREVIALNAAFPTDRRRFSALHELGHLVLRFAPGQFPEREQERLCHRFAGAMLMPRPIFEEAFGGHRQHVAVGELAQLKAAHGISCAAIMKRAETLGLMAASTMERFWTSWSVRGYRTNDPGRCDFPEQPRRFHTLLLRAVAERRLSVAKAASLAAMPEEEFRDRLEILP